jgi:hypothetical protein
MNQSTPSPSQRLKPIGILFALFGLLLFVYFLWKAGPGEVASGIRKLGAGFLLVLAISSLRYVVRTLGWVLCFTGEHRLRFRDAFRAYVVGDAMGNLTPLGLVASEPTKAALVRDRVPLVTAISALAVQNLFYSLSVALFILSGIVTLLVNFSLPRGLRLMSLISLGVVCAVILFGLIVYRMRWRFITAAFTRLRRSRLGQRFLKEKQKESTSAVEDTIYSFYSRNKARCALILLLEVCFHLAGVLEVYVTLSFIRDSPPPFLAAYVLESVNRIINVVFKFVPLRAGVDEAGSNWVTQNLLRDASGITLGVVRKARVICWTALGVAFLIRRGLSAQAVADEAQEAVAEEMGGTVPRVSEQG